MGRRSLLFLVASDRDVRCHVDKGSDGDKVMKMMMPEEEDDEDENEDDGDGDRDC